MKYIASPGNKLSVSVLLHKALMRLYAGPRHGPTPADDVLARIDSERAVSLCKWEYVRLSSLTAMWMQASRLAASQRALLSAESQPLCVGSQPRLGRREHSAVSLKG